MNVKASEITDPAEMLERIAYRNKRIITRVDGHDDAAAFAKHLASRTRSDIKRLAELLGITLSND
jgi:ribosomal protein L32E